MVRAEDGGEDCEEAPGELEEGQFGGVVQMNCVMGVRRRVMVRVRMVRDGRSMPAMEGVSSLKRCGVSPLRCAPVEMTHLYQSATDVS